ncbi:hypothetical protein Tco_0959457 [Tanacetum coccineum]
MSGKSSPLKRLIIGINVWAKLSEGENIFTPTTDSYASNPTPIDCMERVSYIPESHGKMVRWLDEEIPRNRIPTLKKDLLGVARFPRWVEAKVDSFEVEGEKWRRFLLHRMCVAIDAATDSREEEFFPRDGR